MDTMNVVGRRGACVSFFGRGDVREVCVYHNECCGTAVGSCGTGHAEGCGCCGAGACAEAAVEFDVAFGACYFYVVGE